MTVTDREAATPTPSELASALAGETDRQRRNREIATDLCNSIRDHVLAHITRMPEDWDGHEIRELLADLFDRERTEAMKRRPRRDRYRSGRFNHLNI